MTAAATRDRLRPALAGAVPGHAPTARAANSRGRAHSMNPA